MGITYEICTYIGNREINEDYANAKICGEDFLAVVADGLGGHDKGEVASKLVTDTMLDSYDFEAEDRQEELHRVMKEAQQTLMDFQKKEKAEDSMKTTCVALAVHGNSAHIGHVGDSRGYAFYKNKTWTRTNDHSVTQMLAMAGEIKEKQIRYHEDRNKLLRVFGSEWYRDSCEFSPDIETDKVKTFLLCTDGFWELITEEQMQKLLKKSETPKEWLDKMIAVVEKAGQKLKMDNYTAIAVFVE